MNNTTKVIIFVVIVIAIVIGMKAVVSTADKPSKYEPLAQCLKDSGVKFFGAFWCPHCQNQEKEFQMSRQKLESIGLYKECSTPDGAGQTQICKDEKITGYPTWKFPDGSELSGEVALSTLAEKSGCKLPQ